MLFCLFSLFIGAAGVFFLTAGMRRQLKSLTRELGALTSDVDELIEEVGGSAGRDEDGNAQEDAVERAGNELQELGTRIQSMRGTLRQHIEQQRSQEKSMINALSSDYRSVYYVDLDRDEGLCYRADNRTDTGIREGDVFPYLETCAEYANTFVTPNDREEFLHFIRLDAIRNALRNQSLISFRYLTKKYGGERYEMIRVAAIRHPEDQDLNGVHAVSIGFSDVDWQTREALAQRQALRDALQSAENASKAKTSFLSSMSHEIRTPMNAILDLDSLALSDPDIPQKTREYLEKIGDSAKHLLGLINDILDMSRIESGRMTVKSEEFRLGELLDQINTIIESQCRDKGLQYDCTTDSQLASYYIGDSMKLKQVAINILGNAVKFTPEGGRVSLDVRRAAQYDGKTVVCFTMKDTGIGMDREFIPKIFDAFSQEDGSRCWIPNGRTRRRRAQAPPSRTARPRRIKRPGRRSTSPAGGSFWRRICRSTRRS